MLNLVLAIPVLVPVYLVSVLGIYIFVLTFICTYICLRIIQQQLKQCLLLKMHRQTRYGVILFVRERKREKDSDAPHTLDRGEEQMELYISYIFGKKIKKPQVMPLPEQPRGFAFPH